MKLIIIQKIRKILLILTIHSEMIIKMKLNYMMKMKMKKVKLFKLINDHQRISRK